MSEQLKETILWMKERIHVIPEIAVILGSGLGDLVKSIAIQKAFPYEEIPHFPLSTVEGHQGRLIFGQLGTNSNSSAFAELVHKHYSIKKPFE